jgi:hypothetical protein
MQISIAAFLIVIAAMMPQQGVESLVPPPTQETEESSAPSSSPSENGVADPIEEERIQAEVAEIMAIRKQLGGGVAETLGDLSLDMPGAKPQQNESDKKPAVNYESEFEEILAKRSRSSMRPPHQTSPEIRPEPEIGLPVQLLPIDSVERQESIRHAARMLEEAAAALEEASVYDRADEIRQTAVELWRSAR